jgi:hypothetical protein
LNISFIVLPILIVVIFFITRLVLSLVIVTRSLTLRSRLKIKTIIITSCQFKRSFNFFFVPNLILNFFNLFTNLNHCLLTKLNTSYIIPFVKFREDCLNLVCVYQKRVSIKEC